MGWESADYKPYTMETAHLVFSGKLVRGPDDWFPLAQLIADLIKSLFGGCAPTPVQAVRWLNWKPYPIFDWWGERLKRHHDGIRVMAKRKWLGNSDEADDVADRLLQAVKDGKANEWLMTKLYKENAG